MGHFDNQAMMNAWRARQEEMKIMAAEQQRAAEEHHRLNAPPRRSDGYELPEHFGPDKAKDITPPDEG